MDTTLNVFRWNLPAIRGQVAYSGLEGFIVLFQQPMICSGDFACKLIGIE